MTRPSPVLLAVCFSYVDLEIVECSMFEGIKRVQGSSNQTTPIVIGSGFQYMFVCVCMCLCLNDYLFLSASVSWL